jgi:hypothetical protein
MRIAYAGGGAAFLVIVSVLMLSGCGTAHLAGNSGLSRPDMAIIRGDLRLGPLGNATVRLQAVDGKELGKTDRQATVAPGKHTLTFSCHEAIKNIGGSGQMTFAAKAGHTYDLQLRQPHQSPDCSAVLTDSATDKVVAKPVALRR